MDKYLLVEMIEELEDYRQSMHYADVFGEPKDKGNNKTEFQKNLERIINQAKAQLAVVEEGK